MEICYLRGSPWSLRLVWALNCFPQEQLNGVVFKAYETADQLAKRAAKAALHKAEDKSNTVITLPMMFYQIDNQEYVIRNGIDIVEYFANEFPESSFARNFLDNKEEIFLNNEKIDRICRFCRNVFFSTGSDFAYYLAPAIVAFIPGLSSLIGKYISSKLGNKYNSIGSKYSKAELEALLEEFNQKLENGYFFGDDVSYNDITLFATVEFIKPSKYGNKPLTFLALNKSAAIEIAKFGWESKFPNIFSKKDAAFDELLTEKTIDTCHLKVKRPVASL